jgi:predicted GH43/DUF377 family glycosyl hydrolase
MYNDPQPPWVLGPFIRPPEGNPVLSPDPASTFLCPIRKIPVKWQVHDVFNPAAIVHNNKVYLIYRAEDDFGQYKIGRHTSRLGLAESEDGIHFKKFPDPILFPDHDHQYKREWNGGCEDPRIVEGENGEYILTYTQKDHLISRLGIAKSKDLIHWEKCGPAFHKKGHPFLDFDTKAASIVCSLIDGKLKATRINGKYYMYWGVRKIYVAISDDLIHWETIKTVATRRKGFFDRWVAEAGPPAVITKDGIVLMYNGKNDSETGDVTLKHHLYTGGQFLFDKKDPTKILGRTNKPFYGPELPCEVTGQYVAGTTFLEGLVYFKEKWFLYYGCGNPSIP